MVASIYGSKGNVTQVEWVDLIAGKSNCGYLRLIVVLYGEILLKVVSITKISDLLTM